MVRIETDSNMTKAQAKEVTTVLLNARQLIKNPEKKLVDSFKFIPFAIIFTLIAFASFLFFLSRDKNDMLAAFGLGIAVIALAIEIVFAFLVAKYYKMMKNRDAKVIVTLDENGVVYEEVGAKTIHLAWNSISFIRLFKESVCMFPNDLSGILILLSAKEAEKIREFLAETPVQVKTIDL